MQPTDVQVFLDAEDSIKEVYNITGMPVSWSSYHALVRPHLKSKSTIFFGFQDPVAFPLNNLQMQVVPEEEMSKTSLLSNCPTDWCTKIDFVDVLVNIDD